MATAYKVLAQSAPSATTETTLYTVPAGTSAVVSTMAIANNVSGKILVPVVNWTMAG